ncbi:hypothetical protein JMJ77_0011362 [Colletotrichum scovillei]|uniref:Uncharacterized protein n=1 Tax=Colletotrichum scovillei TaxID=1209932 RepID=A0A9P7UA21_9PEZI|nr:hypothetical protein JMJ77_0011362 [Colletotrichum scovillei]KAG7060347.1 hypothetical protein JMJ78_0015622 [Colletotrichum scovillei]KAG7067791.1 hypothetical protein JMJ76_0009219 [Colletotrichum scovillei]
MSVLQVSAPPVLTTGNVSSEHTTFRTAGQLRDTEVVITTSCRLSFGSH